MEEDKLLKMRKRFVKDEKLPIPVFHSPYFEYFLDLYEDLLETRSKYEKYKQLIEKIGWENYYRMYNRFKDEVIQHVTSKASYKKFLNMDMGKFNVERSYKYRTSDFYCIENIGIDWVSVDLMKANFHSLRYVNPDIVDYKDTYEEWISSFENGDLFGHLKSIRQIIFGNLSPKRQRKIQSYILHELMTRLEKDVKGNEFWILGVDEFIIENSDDVSKWLEKNMPIFEKETGFKLRKEEFLFVKNGKNLEFGYIKTYRDGSEELVGVSKYFYAQAYKYYKDLDLNEYDLLFYHEGHLSRFMYPIHGEGTIKL